MIKSYFPCIILFVYCLLVILFGINGIILNDGSDPNTYFLQYPLKVILSDKYIDVQKEPLIYYIYGFFLSICDNFRVIYLVNFIIVICNTLLIKKTINIINSNSKYGDFGSLIYLLYPQTFVFILIPQIESIEPLFLCSMIYFAVKYKKINNYKYLIIFSVISGLAFLAKVNLIIISILLLIYMTSNSFKRYQSICIYIFFIIIINIIWTGYIYIKSGHVIVSRFGMNPSFSFGAYVGNNPISRGNFWDYNQQEVDFFSELLNVDSKKYLYFDFINKYPSREIALIYYKLKNLFIGQTEFIGGMNLLFDSTPIFYQFYRFSSIRLSNEFSIVNSIFNHFLIFYLLSLYSTIYLCGLLTYCTIKSINGSYLSKILVLSSFLMLIPFLITFSENRYGYIIFIPIIVGAFINNKKIEKSNMILNFIIININIFLLIFLASYIYFA